jgi:hypothetical protein
MSRERTILIVGGALLALTYYGLERHVRPSEPRFTSETHLGSVGAVTRQPTPDVPAADVDDTRARAILAAQHARHSFLGKVSEFGGATRDVSLWLPMLTADWRRLSIADKAAIVRYMNEQPARARRNPQQYIDISRAAPLYPTIVERVSKVAEGNWFIMGGQLVDQGTDMDEGDILACGDATEETGCDDAQRAVTLLTKWGRQ